MGDYKSKGTYLCAILACAAVCQACRLIWVSVEATSNSKSLTEKSKELPRTENPDLNTQQRSRLLTIERECKKYENELKFQTWRDSIPHMIVDDKRKILFCDIPKVASSNWKRAFIEDLNITINGSSYIRDVHAKGLLPDLRYYSTEEQKYRLKNYFKFMFVRHPLERLLSAYRNKLENREIEWQPVTKHSRDVTGNYRSSKEIVMRVKSESQSNGNTITFNEFVSTLTDPAYRIKHYNTHWKQYHKLCHPCFVKYDFIGKLESFRQDLDFIEKKTGIHLEKWFTQEERTTLPNVANEYYKTLRVDKMTDIFNMYDIDLKMYEYDRM